MNQVVTSLLQLLPGGVIGTIVGLFVLQPQCTGSILSQTCTNILGWTVPPGLEFGAMVGAFVGAVLNVVYLAFRGDKP